MAALANVETQNSRLVTPASLRGLAASNPTTSGCPSTSLHCWNRTAQPRPARLRTCANPPWRVDMASRPIGRTNANAAARLQHGGASRISPDWMGRVEGWIAKPLQAARSWLIPFQRWGPGQPLACRYTAHSGFGRIVNPASIQGDSNKSLATARLMLR